MKYEKKLMKVFVKNEKGEMIETEVTVLAEKPKKDGFIKKTVRATKDVVKHPKKLIKPVAFGVAGFATGCVAVSKILEAVNSDGDSSIVDVPSVEDYTAGLLESNQESLDTFSNSTETETETVE